MKKKLFCLLLILILPICLLFVGCGTELAPSHESDTGRFVEVYAQNGDRIRIFVDKYSSIMYLFVKNGYGGGLTVMLNSDGAPMLWEGEL